MPPRRALRGAFELLRNSVAVAELGSTVEVCVTKMLRRALRRWCAAGCLLAVFASSACAPELTPAREQDVVAALLAHFVPRMGKVVVASQASDCRTDGETAADVPAGLFAAFLAANRGDVDGLDLAGHAVDFPIDSSGASPRAVNARRRQPVVVLSRVGLVDDEALICVEVVGVEERTFFVLLERDAGGSWSLRGEWEAWRQEVMPWQREPEELPDGRPYEG